MFFMSDKNISDEYRETAKRFDALSQIFEKTVSVNSSSSVEGKLFVTVRRVRLLDFLEKISV